MDEFLKAKRKATRDQKHTHVMVFGTVADKQGELSEVKLFLTSDDLAQKLIFVDPMRSAHGLDGRRGS